MNTWLGLNLNACFVNPYQQEIITSNGHANTVLLVSLLKTYTKTANASKEVNHSDLFGHSIFVLFTIILLYDVKKVINYPLLLNLILPVLILTLNLKDTFVHELFQIVAGS